MLDDGVIWLLADDASRARVEVSAVLGAQHLTEFRPRLERRQARVRSDEPLPAAYERQKFGLLRIGDRHVAVAEEEDAVNIAQARASARGRPVGLLCLIEDDVRIGPDERVPEARVVAEPLDDRQRVRGERVLRLAVSRIRPREQRLAHARLGAPSAAPALPSTRAPAALPARRRFAHGWSLSAARCLWRGRRSDHCSQADDAGAHADERSDSHELLTNFTFAFRQGSVYATSVSAPGLCRNPRPPAATTTYCLPSRPR